MRIDHPEQGNIPKLRGLWQEAFGDTDGFLDRFFATGFHKERCLCVTENDTVAAALYWFDCQFQQKTVAYLYAVATGKAFQNRGFCRMLIEKTHELLRKQGYAGAVLVPGSESLFDLYRKMGYKTLSCMDVLSCTAGTESVDVRRISAAQFGVLRRSFLPKNSIFQEKEGLLFLDACWQLYTGEDFLLAAMEDGDRLVGMELLGNPAAAPGILAALGKKEGTFRTPGVGDFAMYHSLNDSRLPHYFGLAFD